jgi:AcrR family transcriptional regulator
MNVAGIVPGPALATVPYGRPMRSDARRNQQLVLNAARDAVAEFGDDATVEQIAIRAGVGVGTIYRHFPNKAALYDELIRIIVTDLIELATTALAAGDGSGLESFLIALGQSIADHRGYADQLMQHADGVRNDHLRTLIAELVSQAAEHQTIDTNITTNDIMTAIAGLRGVIGAPPPLSSSWRRHLTFQLRGMRAVGSSDFPARRPPLPQSPPNNLTC